MVLLPRIGLPRRPSTYLAAILFLTAVLYLYSNNGKVLVTQINQHGLRIEDRIQVWNWKDTKEEIFCQAAHELDTSKKPIPNVVHFVILADEGRKVELAYTEFLAMKAAVLHMNASEVKLHTTGLNKSNKWWKQIKNHVTHVPINRNEYQTPNGQPLSTIRLPHQSDIVRLDIIMREGGIYLDTDVFTLKPFSNLLTNPRDIVMAHEGGNRYGLCNAVIAARPHSAFMTLWQESYATFDATLWNEHSVKMPKLLQVQHPDLICPLSPTTFFWPTWAVKHVKYMHEPITKAERLGLEENMEEFGGAMYANQLAFHAVAAKEYMSLLTPEVVKGNDTRFNVLVREIAAAPLP